MTRAGTEPKSEKGFRLTLHEGDKWIHFRIEAEQDNDPRYQVRRGKIEKSDPDWCAYMGGFIAGFAGMWGPER